LKKYNVTVNGVETTLLLSDRDAEAMGLKKPAAKEAKAPANKEAAAPANKAAARKAPGKPTAGKGDA